VRFNAAQRSPALNSQSLHRILHREATSIAAASEGVYRWR
jgi:hypothetical protein